MDTEKLDDDVLETTEVIADKEETVSAEEYVTDEIRIENSSLSPYSPLYNPRLDRSKEGKKNKVIFAGIIGVLILAVIGLIITMSIVVKNAMSEVEAKQDIISEWFSDLKEEIVYEFLGDLDSYDYDYDYDYDTEDSIIYDYDEYDEYDEGYEYSEDSSLYHTEEYQPCEHDDYYVTLADSIRNDLSYQVIKDVWEYEEEGVYFYIEYPIIDAPDLENVDALNEELMNYAVYNSDLISNGLYNSMYCLVTVEAFITNMTEDSLSIAYRGSIRVDEGVSYELLSVNLNMEHGYFFDDSDLINVDEELVDAFLLQSEYQNGTNMESNYTREEIISYFNDESSLIVFYTPVGLEVGINHPNGWTTATFKEYDQFLPKL